MPRPNWLFAFPLDGHFLLELPQLPTSFRLFHVLGAHVYPHLDTKAVADVTEQDIA